jgi:hypothetical protein
MESSIYDEIDRVFEKVEQFRENGEEVPIHQLFYCYTVRPPSHTQGYEF